MTYFKYVVCCFSILCGNSYFSLLAQSIKIEGQIKDELNKPIAFANVLFLHSNVGTNSDDQGNFELNLPGPGQLKIFLLGYEDQIIDINVSQSLNIILKEEHKILKEVAIIGYGSLKKSDQTGSAQGFKAKDINNAAVLSATQILQSKAAGVQIVNSGAPGSAPKVRVRGVGSIYGGADPLYVVDGIITSDIRNINVADIERMDILKDASSTSIYGARAANGVVLITTKNARKKELQYNAYAGFQWLTHKVKMSTPGYYAQYCNEAAGFPAITAGEVTGKSDWYKEISRLAFMHKHDLSYQNKLKNYNYFLSGSYLNANGVLLDNNYSRLSARLNHGLLIKKIFKIDHTLSLSHYISNNKPYSLFTQAYIAAPIYNAKNSDGTYGNTSSVINNVGNPLATLKNLDDKSYGNRIQTTLSGELSIFKNLKLKSQFGVDLEKNNGRVYTPEYYTYQPNGVKGAQFNELADLHFQRDTIYQWVWDNTISYNVDIGSSQKITLLAGHTAERRDGWKSEADINNNSILNTNAFKTLNFSDSTYGQQNKRTPIENYFRRESYFGRINYKLLERYLLNATLRSDASSNFPTSNRSAVFPALGLGWIISEENFMKHQSLINELKLRFSYGLTGNDVIKPGQFDLRPTERLYSYFGTNRIDGATVLGIIDPNLKWEVVQEYDFGLEYSLLNSSLSGELDFYHKLAKDALFEIPYPSLGFGSTLLTNAADVMNQGVEFSIQYFHRQNENIDHSYKFNISANKNLVKDVGAGKALNFGSAGNGFTVTQTLEGQAIGSFWVYQTNGIYQDEESIKNSPHTVGTKPGDFIIVDKNKDGIIDNNDRVHIGSNQPKFFFGFQYGVHYKNWDANIDIYGNVGSLVYNAKKGVKFGSNYNVELDLAKNRWLPGSNDNEHPRPNNITPLPSDYFVESGSFYRINAINIGYNFPQQKINKYFSKLRASLTSHNPYLFTTYSGFTPELPGNQNESGIELNVYPVTAMLIIGLQATLK